MCAADVAGSLHWHVHEACLDGVAIHSDAMLMQVLSHENGGIRRQGAVGVGGVGALCAAADVCDAAGEHLKAARLMWAATAVRGANVHACNLFCRLVLR